MPDEIGNSIMQAMPAKLHHSEAEQRHILQMLEAASTRPDRLLVILVCLDGFQIDRVAKVLRMGVKSARDRLESLDRHAHRIEQIEKNERAITQKSGRLQRKQIERRKGKNAKAIED